MDTVNYTLDNARLADMPNQEEFKNLMVEPSDIRPQSCSWETPQRVIEVPLSKQAVVNSEKQQTRGSTGPTNMHGSKSTSRQALNLLNSKDEPESLDIECDVITFVINAANVRDKSKPMPPPSRFVRKGDSRQ